MNCNLFNSNPNEKGDKQSYISNFKSYAIIIFSILFVFAIAGVGAYYIYIGLLNNSYTAYNIQYDHDTVDINFNMNAGLINNNYVVQFVATQVSHRGFCYFAFSRIPYILPHCRCRRR